MTTKDLKNHVYGFHCERGRVQYTLRYRNREYACASYDTEAYDRLTECDCLCDNEKGSLGLTLNQALQCFYKKGVYNIFIVGLNY